MPSVTQYTSHDNAKEVLLFFKKARALTQSLVRDGLFSILGASTVNKVLVACLQVFVIRILSQDAFGAYAYASNIISLFLVLNGLGAPSAVLQMCSETMTSKARQVAYYLYGTRFGILADTVIVTGVFLTGWLTTLAVPGSNAIVLALCAYPLLVLLSDLRLTWLRATMQNRGFARMTNLRTVAIVSLSLIGAKTLGVYGLIAGQYLGEAVSLVAIRHYYPVYKKGNRSLPRNDRDDFNRIAILSSLNNGLSQALTLIGTFLVGALLHSADEVAFFKVASTVPFALMFIPTSVIVYVYPHFAKMRNNRKWTLSRYLQLTSASIFFYGIITVTAWFLAGPLMNYLFTDTYSSSVTPFRILMVGFFANAAFRQPAGNLLITQRMLVANTVTGIILIGSNIALSYGLIPALGTNGAALAWSITMGFGAILSPVQYLRRVATI